MEIVKGAYSVMGIISEKGIFALEILMVLGLYVWVKRG